MKQKRIILLALALILTMCSDNSTTEIVESVEDVEVKQSQQENTQEDQSISASYELGEVNADYIDKPVEDYLDELDEVAGGGEEERERVDGVF